MKKSLRFFMLTVLFLPFALHAQLSAVYQFSTGIDTTRWYTLTNDSVVLKVGADNDSYASPVTDIGFTFNFAGVDYTQFSANSDGTVRLGSTAIAASYYTTPFSSSYANYNNPKICGLGCDGYLAAATANSPADYIAYQLFGSEGYHVLVIEISTGTYNSDTRYNHYTFQIQLTEADNSMTLIYSPTAPVAGPAVTYQLGACTSASDVVLFNVATNTMSVYTNGTNNNNAAGTWPDPGRYYTIAPNPNACYPVSELTATNITSSGTTLTWSDTNNIGATYTVYNGDIVLASGITGNSYTVTDLIANTSYVFNVVSSCTIGSESNPVGIDVHTACGPTALPWTCSFEENEIVSTTATTALPWCSERYVSAATYGYNFPYSYNGSTYAHSGSRSLYFYGTTASTYPDTMAIILPEIDVVNYPMTGNRLTFWAKMGAVSNTKNVYVGTLTDPTDISTFTLVQSVTVSGTTPTKFSVPLTNATGAYVALVVLKGTGNMYIDDVSLEEMPSCLEVTNLAVTSISSNSISFSWTDSANVDATYTIYDMSDSSVVDTTSSTTYTVNNLTPNTVYTFGVQTNCTSGDGPIMLISDRTSCSPEALPFSETFDASLASDPCWAGATGVTAEEALSGSVLTLTANSQWTYASGESNGIPAGHYRVNIYGTSCKKWMITPEIDLTTATNPLLTFDAAFTAYTTSSTDPASGFENNPSQAFMILVSTNGGQTWTTASNISLTAIASSTYLPQYVNLSAYTGQTVRIAFYAQSTVTGGDNNLHIDNILVEEYIGELCLPVNMLTAGNVTSSEATLTWEGDAASYNVYVLANGDTTLVQNVTTDSIHLTGLQAMTAYTYGVRAVCSENVSPIATVSFSTACTAVTLPYTETYETTSNTLGCWTVEGMGNWTFGTGDYHASTGSFQGSQNAKITHGTTGDVTKFISPALDGAQYGLLLDFAYVMCKWGSDVDELRVYSRANESSAWQQVAEYTTEAPSWTVESVIIPGSVYQIAFEYTDGYGYGLGIDSVVFTPLPSDFCFPVTNLTVDSTAGNSVSISWNGNAASYDLYNGSTLVANVTTNSYTFTGLNASTDYTFGVQAIYSATNSATMVTVDAATDCGIINAYPYVQDFTAAPNCWMALDADGDGQTWIFYEGTMQSASYNSVALTPDNWLISPQFAIPATGNYEVTWTATAQDQSWPAEHYGIFVSTTDYSDTANFTMLQEWTLGPGLFNPVVDLSNYAGQNIYIALRHFNCTDQFRLSIDDFIVREQAGANQVTINVGPNNPGYGTVSGAGIYNIGDNVTVSATANTGYTFAKWVDETNIVVSTDNPYTFVAATDLHLTAIFLDNSGATYTITVQVNDSTMGTAVGGGTYTAGDQVTLSATPFSGYNFVNWTQVSGFGTNVVGTDPDLIITVTSDKTFVANFEVGSGPVITNPTVATNAATSIGQTAATLSATITNPDNVTVTAKGFEWKATTGGTYTQVTGTGTGNNFSYNLSGLTPNTSYTYKAFISFNGTTVYGDELTFTTQVDSTGIEDRLAAHVKLFPNPTSDVVNVQCTMNNVQLTGELSVFDVYGKLLQIVSITSEITPVNVSGLADGMYFVRVTTEKGAVTKTFVKK